MVLIHPLPSNTGMFVPPNGNGVGNGVGGGGYIYAPLAPATSSAVAAQSVHQAVHGLVHKWEPPEAHQNNNNINAPKYPWPDQYLLFNPALDPYPPIDPCPSTSMANFPSYYQSLKQHEIPACYHQNPTAAAVAAYSNNSAPCPAISAAPEYFQHHQAAHHVSAIQHNPGHQWKFPTAVQEQRRSQLPLKLATPYKTGPGTNNVRVRTQEKYRMVYDDQQRLELEKEFHTHQFITAERKSQLSTELSLTERQIKIWFQNRRAKDRREKTKTMQRH